MAVVFAIGFFYSFFSLIFLLLRALSLPLLLLLAFWGYKAWYNNQERKRIMSERANDDYLNLNDNLISTSNLTQESYLKNGVVDKYPFSQWHRGIANTYDNICFYVEKIKASNLPFKTKDSAENLYSQANIVMDKLQELENIGRLNNNSRLIEHSSLKLDLIESRFKKLLEDASKELESIIIDLDVESGTNFNDRISAIRESGVRVLQLLDTSDHVTETYFTVKKVLNVRLEEVLVDYKEAKQVKTPNNNSDVIMNEALTHIERIISDAENEVISNKYNNAINNLQASNKYLEKR